MTSSSKYLRSVAAGIALLSVLGACSDPKTSSADRNQSDKLELSGSAWYDYGNGVINLSRVTRISSNVLIYGEVTSKEYFNNEKSIFTYMENMNDEQRAVFESHLDFCFDKLRSSGSKSRFSSTWDAFRVENTLGYFENGGGRESLEKIFRDVKSYVTPEFAETCVIKLRGRASLSFDNFTVNLEQYNSTLIFEKNKDGQYLKEEIDQKFDDTVGRLGRGETPWNGAYSSLFKS